MACEPGSLPDHMRPHLSLSSVTGRGWHFICVPAWLGRVLCSPGKAQREESGE